MVTSKETPSGLASEVHSILVMLKPEVDSWDSLWENIESINDKHISYVTRVFVATVACKADRPKDNLQNVLDSAISIAWEEANGKQNE